jgi:GT2 family glycosyltransferase
MDDLEGFRRSIDSMSEQSLVGVELVVVDSSADSLEISRFLSGCAIPDYQCEWVEPQGIYSAMNRGLELARGDYIYFLNAGDSFFDQLVLGELGVLFAENSPAWIIGRVQILEQTGESVTSALWDYETEKKALFARGLFPPHQGTVVKTEVLRSVGGFNERFVIAADYAAALALSQVHDPLMTERVIATFFEGGISTTRWQDSFWEFHQARREVFAPRGLAALEERFRYWQHFLSVWLVRKVRRN